MKIEPLQVILRMLPVGFGDCFLLSFIYKPPRSNQHILIDFGTVGGKADMHQVANDIKSGCDGKLYAVVATHRHRDHISGFSTKGGDKSTGAIVASCNPEVVVQPWTEDPKAAPNAQTESLLSDRRNLTDRQLYLLQCSQ
jgi:glyoxylase-like metal-dependent hydrolase (beta-lactamase superfamily II)